MDFESVKEEIKRRVKLEDIVSQHVALQRAGSRLRARCPFHQEKTPSFYVNPALGFWKCFGCGAGGDVFDFVMRIEGLTFSEAGERLAERVGLQWRVEPGEEARAKRRELSRRANELAVDYFEKLLRTPAGKEGLDYLYRRQFTDETIARFRLGWAADSWDALLRHLRQQGLDEGVAVEAGLAKERATGGAYDVFRRRVMFPILDVSGRTIGFGGRALDPDDPAKYLNTADTPMFKKGHHVYALGLARPAIVREKSAVIVEGYTDVISLHQAGVENVVACLGTALTQDHLNLLSRYAEEIVLAYDADAAGIGAAARNIPMLEACAAEVKIVLLPTGLDPDDLVRQQGPEGFRQALAKRSTPVEYEIELKFAQQRDRGPDGVLRAAREAVEVLLRVPDRTRRDEFLRRAADLWGQGYPGRTAAMERSLREEVKVRLGQREAPSRNRAESPRDRGFITATVARQASEVDAGVQAAERELLCAALMRREWAVQVTAQLQPEEFNLELHQKIAEALGEALPEAATYSAAEVLRHLEADQEAWELAATLTLEEPQQVDEVLSTNITTIKNYRSSGGYRGLYVVPAEEEDTPLPQVDDWDALRRRVTEKINAGVLDPEDPDLILYKTYTARFHGKGQLGFVGGESGTVRGEGAQTVARDMGQQGPEALADLLPEDDDPFAEEGS